MKELQVLKGQLAAAEERERETKLQSGSEHAKVTALQVWRQLCVFRRGKVQGTS